MNKSRRTFLKVVGTGLCIASSITLNLEALMGLDLNTVEDADSGTLTLEEWMDAWMNSSKAVDGVPRLGRFADPMYYLTKSIGWKPNPGQESLRPVRVPVGFVTDFASIPKVFWSIFRPDDLYAYAAIIHDFLYWDQTRPREEADMIFDIAMKDFQVPWVTEKLLYFAVRVAGDTAWGNNKLLKERGERRVLKVFPDDPTLRWNQWKAIPSVFVP